MAEGVFGRWRGPEIQSRRSGRVSIAAMSGVFFVRLRLEDHFLHGDHHEAIFSSSPRALRDAPHRRDAFQL